MIDVTTIDITVDEQIMPAVVVVDDVPAGPAIVEIITGMPGPPGPTGPTGPAGGGNEGGGAAGRFFDFVYDPSIDGTAGRGDVGTMPDGTLRFDNEDQTQATTVYISSLSASGVDVSTRLAMLPVGTPMWIQDRDDSTMHATYTLTGPATYIEGMGAWESPIAYVPEQSGDPVQPGQMVLAGALDTAGGGTVGPTGPAGPPGILRVDHGSDPSVPRPAAPIVLWVGSVTPTYRDESVDLIAWTP